tara:strand:+ start:482 stop:841 length:360 start_codon:yes stop_codon:yes gene_type:complete
MACQILICNKVGSKGEISTLSTVKDSWTSNETLRAWRKSYPDESVKKYHRNFSLITVTDKDIGELEFIKDPLIVNNEPVGNKWYFIDPSAESEDWIELFTTGEISKPWDSVAPFLRERS